MRFHAVRVADAVDRRTSTRVCQSLGILQTGKLTLIRAIWFQSVSPRATPRGNLVRSCGIISRIDISQNPRLPSPTLSPTIDHTYIHTYMSSVVCIIAASQHRSIAVTVHRIPDKTTDLMVIFQFQARGAMRCDGVQ